MHVKVHTGHTATKNGKLTGGHVAQAGNLCSSDALNAEVYKRAPYASDTAPIVLAGPPEFGPLLLCQVRFAIYGFRGRA